MKETKNTTWNQKLYSNSSLKGDIKYIFSSAKKNNTSHSNILESLNLRVYKTAKYTTLPNYMQSSLNGYIDANLDLMYDCLEWVHWYNDIFVGKDLPYGKDFKQELINKSAHVYKNTQNIY